MLWTQSYCLLLFAVLVLSAAQPVTAQMISDYDALLRPGARSNAMGNAILSDAGDASMMFLNPATLAVLQSPALFIDHRAQRAHRRMEQTAGFLVATGEQSRFAMAVSAGHRGSIQTEEAKYAARRFSVDLAQSITLAQSFSAGVLAGAGVLTSDGAQLLSIRGILGFHYSPSPEISYALTFRGFEIRSVMRNSAVWDREPGSSPGSLGIGMSMRFPSSYNRQDFTLALSNEKQLGSAGLTYRAGIEYYVVRSVALRVGAVTGPFEQGGRVGIGIRNDLLLMDITLAPGREGHYQLSILFQL